MDFSNVAEKAKDFFQQQYRPEAMKSFGIFAADCNAHFYEDAPADLFCSGCGSYVAEQQYIPKHLNIKKLKKNIASTYDNRLLLSKLARDFFVNHASSKLTFHLVNSNPEFYIMDTDEVVAFNIVKRGTRFVDYCEICGEYESVVGATPIFIGETEQIEPYSVAKTDVSFGSSKEKAPIYIVGVELAVKLKKRFKEIDLLTVER